jgi:hypothetical protein
MSSMPVSDADIVLSIENFYSEKEQQTVHTFIRAATPDFILRSATHPDLHVKLQETTVNSDWAHYEGIAGKIDSEDKPKIAHGAMYSLLPVGDASKTVHWKVNPGISVKAP